MCLLLTFVYTLAFLLHARTGARLFLSFALLDLLCNDPPMFENSKSQEKKKGTLSKVDDNEMNVPVPKRLGVFKYEFD